MDRAAAYEEDVFAWSQHQAKTLRRLAASGYALPNDLDLEHVAGEIEELGISALNSVLSYLEAMLVHPMKAVSSPGSGAMRHWLVGIDEHQRLARRRAPNAMRQRIALDELWRGAGRRAGRSLRYFGEALPPLPEDCSYTLDDLLEGDAAALRDRLAQRAPEEPHP